MSEEQISEDIETVNSNISEVLSLIASYYTTSGDSYRAKSFNTASINVSKYSNTIISGEQVRENIKGIGRSISQVIDEYITTGSVQRLIELETQHSEQREVMCIFTSIYGIGPISAAKFYNMGYRTLEELWNDNLLNDKQRLGYTWKEHIDLRISREEIELIEDRIGILLDPHGIKWIFAGSYRRKEPSSGDIDMLVQSSASINMNNLLSILSSILPVTLAEGPTKFMGLIKLSNRYNAHRLDIRLVEEHQWSYALMYFTGSQRFNILMRQRAIELGLTLNEYSLYNESSQIEANSEGEIFDALGIKYTLPEGRLRDISFLKYVDSI